MAGSHVEIDWLTGLVVTQKFGTTFSVGTGSESQTEISVAPEEVDRTNLSSSTLKRNTKMELSKNDLLKLVTCFEGELQARDIVIAALKSERLKQVATLGRYVPNALANPYTALLRDSISDTQNSKPPVSEKDMQTAAEHQMQALEQLTLQQRWAHQHLINILEEAEVKHKKVIQELEEEKCKHEHDTAQGDDITYGLEMERTRLRQELEIERNARKKLEKEVKRQVELADEERARQKQIVLLLLQERKKIIVKYIEERKRSEDLAQILSEEKARIDSMAEGLEEESKKSLQMEAELEKQAHDFELEKKNLKMQLTAKDQRIVEMETEISRLRAECDAIRNRMQLSDNSSAIISSVAKVVQPTATVSSVPVSGPTTGIAQSVTPGQTLRQTSITAVPGCAKIVPGNPVIVDSSTIRPVAKSSFHSHSQQQQSLSSSAPQTPPKKGAAARGLPPPIPPNKPVIPNKSTATRRPDSGESEKKKANVSSSKDTDSHAPAQQPGLRPSGQGIELLGQELADFQQMFVTMAATSNNT
ncbi:CTTNBP2 N-terminal-like protein [Anthonomus grandis grandis]|uniref:CTTNBP2 N-terminal-like protein n=1 Tax=Anthonomus grandis grandis TaxID=2921223 RepID=UPI00216571E0|nr:CTTNBP2 N-terminal-like protein [Anthonomus grandis grandis]XP_050314259.1 CTTNBP2 N-terminal-like protein [Anthonomus grandis grandis]XP_050314260.1 CTTNBP2 N-terminal-like protein [Anthonomus grandis grandis]XP_050314261.1 CTTNBP2 N-terminal-like protein [Anthonomus grandis grandis]